MNFLRSTLFGRTLRRLGILLILTSVVAFPVWRRANAEEEGQQQLKQAIRQMEQGDSATVVPVLERLAQKFQEEGDLARQAQALRALGDAYARQGDVFFALATERYQEAVDVFSMAATSGGGSGLNAAAAMRFNAQVTLARLGDLYFKAGNPQEAERYYRQIAPDKPKIDVFEAQYSARQKFRDAKNRPGTTKSRAEGTARRLGGLFGRKPSLSTPGQVSAEVSTARSDAAGTAAGVVDIAEDLHRANLLLKGFILSDLSLGRTAVLQGNLDEAREHFESTLNFATRYPPVFGKSSAAQRFQVVALTELGDLAVQQQRYQEASKHYQQARAKARQSKRPDLSWPAARGAGRTEWALARQALSSGGNLSQFRTHRDAALSAYRESMSVIEDLRDHSIRGDEARQSFATQTADVYTEFADLLATLTLRAAGERTSDPLRGEALTFAEEAFVALERARARSLLDLLSESKLQISQGFDPALISKRRELQARQSQLADQLVGLTDALPEKQDDESVEAELDRLQAEIAAIESQLRSANPRYHDLVAPAPVSLSAIQAGLLEPDSVLLSYFVADERSYLWVISREAVRLFPIADRKTIRQSASKVRELMIVSAQYRGPNEPVGRSSPGRVTGGQKGIRATSPGAPERGRSKPGQNATSRKQGTRDLKTVTVPQAVRPVEIPAAREYAESAHDLYQVILAPAEPIINGKRLIVVPDDVLHSIPFEALVTAPPAPAEESPADFSGLQYLVREHEVSYTPSGTVLIALRQHPSTSTQEEGRGALVMADPVFDQTDSRLKGKSGGSESEPLDRDLLVKTFAAAGEPIADTSGEGSKANNPATMRIPRLPATRKEASGLAEVVRRTGEPVDVLLDLQANEQEFVTRDLRRYRFVHLATHGLLNPDRPQFSGLLLSLVGNPNGVDGFLRTQEVFNLQFGSPLVVLSACKTGLGQIRKGEGLIGLPRAFLYAGARSVAVSLWAVDDDSTAALMTRFYDGLLPPKSGEKGLDRAAALRSAQMQLVQGRRYSAPYFWAPFVLVGADR
ncbi:MAG: CHAT domain-containing tetratricopeptide repeat protein [Acidobacteriota bacterium]